MSTRLRGMAINAAWPMLTTYFFIEALDVKPMFPGASRKIANKTNGIIAVSLLFGLFVFFLIDLFFDISGLSIRQLYIVSALSMLPPPVIIAYLLREDKIAQYRLSYRSMERTTKVFYIGAYAIMTALMYLIFLYF